MRVRELRRHFRIRWKQLQMRFVRWRLPRWDNESKTEPYLGAQLL